MALPAALQSLLYDSSPDARRLGAYHLVRQLGSGGFAPVWLAREVYGNTEIRRVAIKLFALDRPSRRGRPSERRPQQDRVMEEARLLCRVEHPNIVRFYTLLIDEERGVVGLVMEYVEGASLAERLRQRGEKTRLAVDEVLRIGASIASALAAVHRSGLVHRDVKPANIVESSGTTKLIDFGIAAADRRSRDAHAKRGRVRIADLPANVVGSSMSALGHALSRADGSAVGESPDLLPGGTVGYIDPICVAEFVPATPASDLYSLGATLFECLTGSLPSVVAAKERGGMSGEVLDGRRSAPPLTEVMSEIPRELSRLVDLLLDPAREKRPASAEQVAVELERLRAARAGRVRTLPPEEIGPFRGLGRFEQSDRDVFFGRSGEVAAAIEMLRSNGLVALVGASGSGKSSLARAGVAAAMAEGGLGGLATWEVETTVPGTDPRSAIAQALGERVPDARRLEADAVVNALSEYASEKGCGVLLVVDQLEELVTVAEPDAARWAAELLARIAYPPKPALRALVAARRDLLDELLELEGLSHTLPRGILLVSSMSAAAWGDVIDQALAAYGYSIEPDARDELMRELKGAAAAMPLVQFALTELWAQRDRERKTITRQGIVAIGGVVAALARHADATLAGLVFAHGADAMSTAREILLAFTTPQGTRATRLSRELEGKGDPLRRAVLSALESARLLTREEGGLTLAHDALMTRWDTLRRWLENAREDRLLAEAIEHDAMRWAEERDDSLLWKKRRLVAAEDLLRLRVVLLSPRAEEFVRRGRRMERLGKVILALAAGIMAAVLGAGMTKYFDFVYETKKVLGHKDEDLQSAKNLFEQSERTAHECREQLRSEQKAKADLKRSLLDQNVMLEGYKSQLTNLDDKLKKAEKDLADEKSRQALDDLLSKPDPSARTRAGSNGPTR